MCGIAGIARRNDCTDDVQSTLLGMRAALDHRGLDDRGVWNDGSGRVGLVHTRLAIMDLSSAGHQPMSHPSGRCHIVFNGEIYNFHELRAELEAAGDPYPFSSRSDTEVLLHLYAQYGAGMVNRLRGMFALAIWDETEKSLFMARDPFGIKPLYYAQRSDALLFASELRALRRSGLVGDALNHQAVLDYFELGSVPEPLTLLKEVQQLPAGHWAVWKEGELKVERYWQVSFPDSQGMSRLSVDEVTSFTRKALVDSVRAHLVSDVPTGIFLSGGIDSTALVALVREAGLTGAVDTFSIGVDDVGLDESRLASRTAKHFQTHHREMQLNAVGCEAIFYDFIKSVDQPSIDGINTYTVSSFARKEGIKVVLSGLGGDELFGGYPSFTKVPQLRRWAARLGLVPGLSGVVGGLLEGCSSNQRLRRLGSMLKRPATMVNAFRAFRGIFSTAEAQQLAAHFSGAAVRGQTAAVHGLSGGALMDDLDAVSECELTLYMRNQLLRDSDVMSMAHGLELRLPYVDRVLFENVAQLPAARRLRQGKQLLLDAVPEVPQWIREQPKRGFMFPYERWLEAKWGDAMTQVDKLIPCAKPSWYQRWAVFMLQNWLSEGK